MKVVHVNYNDCKGGAAIAAYRLCEAMVASGIDSRFLVARQYKKGLPYTRSVGNGSSWSLLKNRIRFLLQKRFLSSYKPSSTFSYPLCGIDLSKEEEVKTADVIILHWVNNGMLTLNGLERILKLGKPVYWFMHDMNVITGSCHHSFDCNKYQTQCENCPALKTPRYFDFVKSRFKHKYSLFRKYDNLKLIAPSQWLVNCAKQSKLTSELEIHCIQNLINTNVFKPLNKKTCKEVFNLDQNKKTVLFGAAGVTDVYKGWKYLAQAINSLDPNKYQCLIFGDYSIDIKDSIKIPSVFTGSLGDIYSLILAYNAADVLVSSSLAENFPNVIVEAMSCGVPCVGFAVGGIPEQIDHLKNGYLAKTQDDGDLSKGIRWVCETPAYACLSKQSREKAVCDWSYTKIKSLYHFMNL